MTPAEIQRALHELQTEVGPRADLYIHVGHHASVSPLYGALYPVGIVDHDIIRASGADWAEVIDDLRRQWLARREQTISKLIEAMALEIIRLTSAQGECTDAALRANDKISQHDIDEYGARACVLANTMAGRGPFSIVATRGANAIGGRDLADIAARAVAAAITIDGDVQ